MKIEKNDIVVVNKKIVQFLGVEFGEEGVIIQDIHTKKELIHSRSIKRKANINEIKWFCENTEHINFIAPIK